MEKKEKYKWIFIFVIMFFINIFSFCALGKNFSFEKFFRPVCSIEGMEDLDYCYHNNPNVIMTISDYYETGYQYLDEYDQVIAKYIDFDIDGQTLIALVPLDVISYLEKGKKISGRLEIIDDGVSLEVIQTIKKDYQERMDLTEDEIDKIFVPIQLNSYGYSNAYILQYGYAILFLSSLGFLIYCGIKWIKE